MTGNPPLLDADVLVIGGGPAGIAAATRSAQAGARTLLIDSGLRPGGQIWRHLAPGDLSAEARRWIDRSHRAGVRWMLRSTVVDGSREQGVVVATPEGSRVVRTARIVIATGARELFLPFPGWTLPNVSGVGGAQALLKGGFDVRGRRAVVAGSGPLLLPVAALLARMGARVVVVAEQAPAARLGRFAVSLIAQPEKLLLAARYRAALPLRGYRAGTWVERADGATALETVTLTDGRRRWTEQCNLLCCSYGLVPSLEVARLHGCAIDVNGVVVDDRQRTSVAGIYCAGEGSGVAGDRAAIAEGEIAGISAATADTGVVSDVVARARDQGRRFQGDLLHAFRPRPEVLRLADAATIVCRCEDVRLGSLDPTWTSRQAKLYTRLGMGACQGAVCGPAVQRLFGWTPGAVRPPLFAPTLSEWPAAPSAALPSPHSPPPA